MEGKIYIVELFNRIISKKNWPIAVYILLNLLFVGAAFMLLGAAMEQNMAIMFLVGILVYLVSLVIALSPIGECILRIQCGCHKIEDEEKLNRLMPLFKEVYENAKKKEPSIADGVKLYINSEPEKNAFATGRKTVCVTEGLLECEDDTIKATLAHEFGHLAHKDTDLLLLVSVGNLIVTAIIVIMRLIIGFIHFVISIGLAFIGKEGWGAAIANAITSMLTTLFITAFHYLWMQMGVLLVMKSSRDMEYKADEFAFRLGYGEELCALLDMFQSSKGQGFFASLVSSHPDKDDRIMYLQSLGCAYVRKGPLIEPSKLEIFMKKARKFAIRAIVVFFIIIFVGSIVEKIASKFEDSISQEENNVNNNQGNNWENDNVVVNDSEQDQVKDVESFNALSDYIELIEEVAVEEILDAIEQVRYAETNGYVYWDAIYFLEKKEGATSSKYMPEIYDSAIVVVSKYLNTKSNKEQYAYCVIPNVTFGENTLYYDEHQLYVRLENTIEDIREMITTDSAYHYWRKAIETGLKEELDSLN